MIAVVRSDQDQVIVSAEELKEFRKKIKTAAWASPI
jgi:hypothetical protein